MTWLAVIWLSRGQRPQEEFMGGGPGGRGTADGRDRATAVRGRRVPLADSQHSPAALPVGPEAQDLPRHCCLVWEIQASSYLFGSLCFTSSICTFVICSFSRSLQTLGNSPAPSPGPASAPGSSGPHRGGWPGAWSLPGTGTRARPVHRWSCSTRA